MMRPEGESSNSNGASKPFSNGSGVQSSYKAATSDLLNGGRKTGSVINGSIHQNGSQQGGKQRPVYHGHDREEVARILVQALLDLGYNDAAEALSHESGYQLESPSVAAFRSAVLQGEWTTAEELLFGHPVSSAEGGISLWETGLALAEGADKNEMRFRLREQKFLELLEGRETARALMVLRTELTPLYQDVGKLHFLSSLLMCQSTEDLKAKMEWDGAQGQSRKQLLSDLSRCISPSVMIPDRRLAVLLQQVKNAQIAKCTYHNTETSPSLYVDHECDRNDFPLRVIHELDSHSGEVWHIQFSHDGSRLASCGKDKTAIIYDTETWDVLHVLADHGESVCSVSWSPDDLILATCSLDGRARLWNTETGDIIQELPRSEVRRFDQPASNCAWAPDGQTIVTGSLGTERNLCEWDLNGNLVFDWARPHRIQDLAISPDGKRLIAMDTENHLHVYNFSTRELEYEMDLKVKLSSISISQDSRCMLVSKADGHTQLFDIESREQLKDFEGHKVGEYTIRSSLGGANESFVISGSADGNIFVWHKENGAQVEKLLDAHKAGCCNSVYWNPANPCMFASAGDDCKVRIWSNGWANFSTTRAASHSNGSQRKLDRPLT